MAIASCSGALITLHSYVTPISSASLITCPCSNNRPTSLLMERLRQPPPQLFTQSVLVDYELALRSAVLKVWPGTALRSCWFHYKQALFRDLLTEGLAADYMVSDSPIRTSFSTLGAMPYDPEEDIELAWKELKLTLAPEMTSFARYYETTWIGTASSPPLFDNASWNHHDSSLMLLVLSSNIADGWNNGFASLVSCRNPTIWSFLECARKEQAITDMKIANILTRRLFSYGTILELIRAVGSGILS